MKDYRKLGIWMDYSTAIIMDYHDDVIDETRILCDFTNEDQTEGLLHSEKMMHNKQQHLQAAYFREICNAMRDFNDVLLFGPSEAKYQLSNLLREDHLLSGIKITLQAVDKMDINQIHTYVRAHFDQ